MSSRAVVLRSGLAVSALATVATACGCAASPIGYATPRTVTPGRATHTVAFEGPLDPSRNELPVVPVYIVRTGIVDRLDVGFRILNGVDVKGHVIRSRVFDLAINPRFQLLPANNTKTFWSLPTIFGLNIPGTSQLLTLVGSAGPVMRFQENRERRDFFEWMVGLDFRPTKSFAVHPAIAWTRQFGADKTTYAIVGIGFTFGGLPSFASSDEATK